MVFAPELRCQHETSRIMPTTFAVVSAHRYEGPHEEPFFLHPTKPPRLVASVRTPYRLDRTMTDENTKPEADLIELTTDIVAAYVSNNPLPAGELPRLIADIHAAIAGVAAGAVPQQPEEKPVPAISVRKSVTPDFLICLEDGKKFKSLKRHLATHHGLTPDEYRQKWNLPADYPMVARNYSTARSALAKSMGLGRKPAPAPVPAKPAAPTRGKKLGLTFG